MAVNLGGEGFASCGSDGLVVLWKVSSVVLTNVVIDSAKIMPSQERIFFSLFITIITVSIAPLFLQSFTSFVLRHSPDV